MNARLTVFPYCLGGNPVGVRGMVERESPERVRSLPRTGFHDIYQSNPGESVFSMAKGLIVKIDPSWLSEVDTVIGVSSEVEFSPHWVHQLNSWLPGGEKRSLYGLQDACTGFLSALELGQALVHSGNSDRVLIVNGDTYTKHIRGDIGLGMLFSDAVSVVAIDSSTMARRSSEVVRGFEILYRSVRNLKQSDEALGITEGQLHMQGAKVFQFASNAVREMALPALEETGLESEEVEWYVHQGSALVVAEVESILGVRQGSLFRAADYGNTVGSSIPIQLFDSPPSKEFVGMIGFGMGLSARLLILRISE